jgi:peptide/nickel transport system substrate-binding protein
MAGRCPPVWPARIVALALASAATTPLALPAAAEPQWGGDMVISEPGRPPTLDAHFSSHGSTRDIAGHVFESLFTLADNSDPIPDLVDTYDISGDGLTYTLRLRHGVKFHNGQTMTAADAVASLDRYRTISPHRSGLANIERVTVEDEHTMVLHLSSPMPTLIDELAAPSSIMGIVPAALASAPGGQLEIVGTGPYRLVDYVPDSHIRLERFEDYTQNTNFDGPTGYGGKRTAYFDSVTFRLIPEANAGIAALETGQVHLVRQIPPDAAVRLDADPRITVYRLMPWWMLVAHINTAEAPTDNLQVRQAIQAALNQEEILSVAAPGLFELNYALQYPAHSFYPGEVGAHLYNQADAGKAKALLAEAGYDGTPINILTSVAFDECRLASVMIAEQLADIGIQATVLANDHAAYASSRDSGRGWNLAVCGHGIEPFLGATAWNRLFQGPDNTPQVDDPEFEAAWQTVLTEADLETRKAAYRDVEEMLHSRVYVIKLGDVGIMQPATARLQNFRPWRTPRMWDVWFE